MDYCLLAVIFFASALTATEGTIYPYSGASLYSAGGMMSGGLSGGMIGLGGPSMLGLGGAGASLGGTMMGPLGAGGLMGSGMLSGGALMGSGMLSGGTMMGAPMMSGSYMGGTLGTLGGGMISGGIGAIGGGGALGGRGWWRIYIAYNCWPNITIGYINKWLKICYRIFPFPGGIRRKGYY